MPMTQRERLMAFLNNEPVDRPPVWLLFPYHPAGYYADLRSIPQYQPVFAAALESAVWLNRRNLTTPTFTPEVTTTHEELVEGEYKVVRTTMAYRDLKLTSEQRTGPSGSSRKPFLTSDDDLRAFAQFPFECDEKVITAALDPQIEVFRREEAEFPKHLGAMMNDLGEPVRHIYHSSDLEEYAVWSITMPELVQQILDKLMIRHRIMYRYLLERDVGEVFFMVGSELASPPLVSRETFRRWIVPHARELIEMIHSYGKKVIQHYHGQIGEILPDFLTMGPDALHTIEAPPVGNCTLTQAFDVVGDRIGLIGNIQYDEFHRLTPREMDRAVRECLDECRGKRFMLSPSAGPYECDPPQRVADNYLQFLRTAEEWLP